MTVGQLGVSLYRVQTACERAGRWQIEAFVSDRDEADRMVEAFQARGERANVTTIDLSDPLERDSVCHNLTAFFQSLKARKSVDLYPSEPSKRSRQGGGSGRQMSELASETSAKGVRRMADRWWIQVCPECNGIVGERTQTHNETCPNRRGRMFVPLDVEVVPASKINFPAGREGLRLDLEDA